MTSKRYLLYISYMGKSFWGAQRQVKRTFPSLDDPNTVQGRLEMGLKELNPTNDPVVTISSRTDSGVHAINTTCHVDLCRLTSHYQPTTLKICLNRYLKAEGIPIRVLQSYLVPETFHCRHNATSRTYLYRLLIRKSESSMNIAKHIDFIPIEELERCYFIITPEFDLSPMMEASKLFEGYHDFRTFMGKNLDEDKVTRKYIHSITIVKKEYPGYSHYSWPSVAAENYNDYLALDIYIKGSSFLYRQVRRTVAALVGVAQGKITLNDIKLMLEIPSHHSWCNQLRVVPAYGLYLCEVGYTKEDFSTFEITSED